MQPDLFDEFLRGLKIQLPYIIAYLIGITIALVYQRRLPRPCLYVFAGCSIKLVVAVVYPLAEPFLLLQGEVALFERATMAIAVVDASAYGLLLLAVFSGRLTTPRRYLWPDDWDTDDELPPKPEKSS